ncbi:methyltransferase [Sphingomonas psychrolutea]|uniref:O-methyltransferase n=1 Tax=Sphingomonas psychrolutea TaxID=1259676 RepID=A0ABQ1GKP0_9SPHN|nr:methyltransferase [Sphingomonas psychrolutea]GGA45820.1 O-methyltransferase [Sphingomonas psychrolutea]
MKLTRPDDNRNWRERWIAWRNRILADPGFQRFAVRFPLTRGIVRARARTMFDLVAGFTYSQTIAACVELGLLELLAAGPLAIEEIAARVDVPVEGTERLLRAAAALNLTQRLDATRWALGADGAALRGNGGIVEMVAHHRLLYADLADPVGLLRRGGGGGQLAHYWTYAERAGEGDGDDVAAYSRLMAASQPLVAQHIIDSYGFGRHARMLDVGGGEARFVRAVAARVPRLALSMFDLPAVGARAKAALLAAGLGNRVEIFGGNFLEDPLPHGHDLITLVRVLHDHDDAPALALLRAVHAALPPGGTLLIAEPMAGTRGAEPSGDAYFGLYLWAMGSGRPRTADEIRRMLRMTGFAESRIVPTALPLTVRIIVATR